MVDITERKKALKAFLDNGIVTSVDVTSVDSRKCSSEIRYYIKK